MINAQIIQRFLTTPRQVTGKSLFLPPGIRAYPAFLGLIVSLFAAGCDSPKNYVAKHKDELTRKLATMEALAAQVESLKPSGAVALADGLPSLDIGDLDYDLYRWYGASYKGTCNAQVFTVQELQDPAGTNRALHVFPAHGRVMTPVWKMAHQGDYPKGQKKEETLSLLKGFSSWRYLVVAKVTAGKDPQVQGYTVTFGAGQSSFTPGTIAGEAFVFDLETRQCLGSVAFSATNSDQHNFYARPSTTAEQKMEMMRQILDADLATQAQKSIAASLLKAAPAKKLIYKNNAANPDGR